MRATVHNLRDGARYRRLVLLAPALLVPIAVMGVTTPSYLEYREALRQESVAQSGFEYAQQKQREWQALGDVTEQVALLDEMNHMLRDLIPGWQEELVVHGAVRDAARHVGMDLTRIQMSDPERRGEALQGQVVVERNIALSAEGHRNAALALIDRLRSQGWPTCVHAIDANADHGPGGHYGYELRLGIFHYAPAANFITPETEEQEGIPTLEEPIE